MLAFLLMTLVATVTSMPQYYDDYGGDIDFEACGRGLGLSAGGAADYDTRGVGGDFVPGPAITGEYPHM